MQPRSRCFSLNTELGAIIHCFSYLYVSIAAMTAFLSNEMELQASAVGLDEQLLRRLHRLLGHRVGSWEQMAMAAACVGGDTSGSAVFCRPSRQRQKA